MFVPDEDEGDVFVEVQESEGGEQRCVWNPERKRMWNSCVTEHLENKEVIKIGTFSSEAAVKSSQGCRKWPQTLLTVP